jgi:prepilin-type N-terminal cleavage/methylation domain-containing protein
MKTSRGFSLVELILAIAVVSIVIVGSATVLLAAQGRSLEAAHQAAATAAASGQLENLRDQDFDAITPGTISFAAPGVPRLVSAQLVVGVVNADLKTATASVSWKEGERTVQVSLPSYIGRYGINRR